MTLPLCYQQSVYNPSPRDSPPSIFRNFIGALIFFGLAIAFFLLGEVPTPAQYVGGSVIIVGIILGLNGTHRGPAPTVKGRGFTLDKVLVFIPGFKRS